MAALKLTKDVILFLKTHLRVQTNGHTELVTGKIALQRNTLTDPEDTYQDYLPLRLSTGYLESKGWLLGKIVIPGEGGEDRRMLGLSLYFSENHWLEMKVENNEVYILEKRAVNHNAEIWKLRFDGVCNNVWDFENLCSMLNLPQINKL